MLKLKNSIKTLFSIFVVSVLIGSVFLLSSCDLFISEEKILTSTSPDNTYTLEAYKVNGGATTDYSIKVYRLSDNILSGKKLIYNKYHDYDAEIKWISNDIVSINDVVLDLSKDEKYDWRSNLDQ